MVATHSVFLPGESHGQRSLEGSRGHKELDMIEQLSIAHNAFIVLRFIVS